MSFEVFWTHEAEITFSNNVEYLFEEWELKIINNFLDRIDEVVDLISQNPRLYPCFSEIDQIHKCVLNEHITLYYRIVDTTRIDLITFWNSHQGPKRLKF